MKMYRKQKSMTVTAQAAGDVMDLSLQELLGKKKKKKVKQKSIKNWSGSTLYALGLRVI